MDTYPARPPSASSACGAAAAERCWGGTKRRRRAWRRRRRRRRGGRARRDGPRRWGSGRSHTCWLRRLAGILRGSGETVSSRSADRGGAGRGLAAADDDCALLREFRGSRGAAQEDDSPSGKGGALVAARRPGQALAAALHTTTEWPDTSAAPASMKPPCSATCGEDLALAHRLATACSLQGPRHGAGAHMHVPPQPPGQPPISPTATAAVAACRHAASRGPPQRLGAAQRLRCLAAGGDRGFNSSSAGSRGASSNKGGGGGKPRGGGGSKPRGGGGGKQQQGGGKQQQARAARAAPQNECLVPAAAQPGGGRAGCVGAHAAAHLGHAHLRARRGAVAGGLGAASVVAPSPAQRCRWRGGRDGSSSGP